jgi:hypothetical protein
MEKDILMIDEQDPMRKMIGAHDTYVTANYHGEGRYSFSEPATMGIGGLQVPKPKSPGTYDEVFDAIMDYFELHKEFGCSTGTITKKNIADALRAAEEDFEDLSLPQIDPNDLK